MKITDLIDYVRELCGNSYSDEMMLRWINQVEAEIQQDVLQKDVMVQYAFDDIAFETELLVPAPQSRLYEDYLMMRVHQAQGEIEMANNDAQNVNTQMRSYAAMIARRNDKLQEE